jgi:hypothetical protein
MKNNYIEILPGIFYEESTGYPWTNRRGTFKRINAKAHGYFRVQDNGYSKYWHRLIYQYFKGDIPENMEVDHLNNLRDDTRIENLTLKTHIQNSRKVIGNAKNTSGYLGVSLNKYGQGTK